MIVKATWTFAVDTSDYKPTFIDIPGLAKDLTKRELAHLLRDGELTADDFEYEIAHTTDVNADQGYPMTEATDDYVEPIYITIHTDHVDDIAEVMAEVFKYTHTIKDRVVNICIQ